MTVLYDVEIDTERPLEENRVSSVGSRSSGFDPSLIQSFSILSSQGEYSDSESVSTVGASTDEETSIMYWMESRRHPQLQRICEVKMNGGDQDQETLDERPEPEQSNGESIVLEHQIQSNEDTHGVDEEKKSVVLPYRNKSIVCILCILVLALLTTIILAALLASHAKAENESNTSDKIIQDVDPTEQLTKLPETVEELDTPFTVVPTFAPTLLPTRAPQRYPTPSPPDAWSYLLDYLGSFTRREFLLDASRPQGRAFLQMVMDHQDSYDSLSKTKILQTYSVLTLYFATSPKIWSSSFTWTDATTDVCSWQGVIGCKELENGELVVENVSASGIGLSGFLPAEICLLEHLERLDLRTNELSGTIPECLSGSSSLKILLLRDNLFSGYLPAGILLVPTLEELEVSNNSLLGNLEMLIDGTFIKNVYRYGEVWRLRRLNLDFNLLSGEIPAFLGALGSLKSLTLHGNDLSGVVDDTLCDRTTTTLEELTVDCREIRCDCCTTCY